VSGLGLGEEPSQSTGHREHLPATPAGSILPCDVERRPARWAGEQGCERAEPVHDSAGRSGTGACDVMRE
jgi:hypothetical protein